TSGWHAWVRGVGVWSAFWGLANGSQFFPGGRPPGAPRWGGGSVGFGCGPGIDYRSVPLPGGAGFWSVSVLVAGGCLYIQAALCEVGRHPGLRGTLVGGVSSGAESGRLDGY